MYPNLFACIVFVNNDLFVAFDSIKKVQRRNVWYNNNYWYDLIVITFNNIYYLLLDLYPTFPPFYICLCLMDRSLLFRAFKVRSEIIDIDSRYRYRKYVLNLLINFSLNQDNLAMVWFCSMGDIPLRVFVSSISSGKKFLLLLDCVN